MQHRVNRGLPTNMYCSYPRTSGYTELHDEPEKATYKCRQMAIDHVLSPKGKKKAQQHCNGRQTEPLDKSLPAGKIFVQTTRFAGKRESYSTAGVQLEIRHATMKQDLQSKAGVKLFQNENPFGKHE